ncbi:MAG: YjfB family protein [Oscillospiraceae bacterium]|nr:YjfB family protein [Oscillospiraceae bacterium]
MVDAIAQMSMAMHQAQLSQSVAVAMTDKVLDMQGSAAMQLLDSMAEATSKIQTFPGDVGHMFDVRA